MFQNLLVVFAILFTSKAFAQEKFEWDTKRELTLENFASPSSEINNELTTYSITSGASIEFNYQMNTYVFMFTKNFNDKVKTTYNPISASIVAPDSAIAAYLLKFGQYHFDLTEQYAREIRAELYRNKNMGSKANFYQEVFDQKMAELNATTQEAMKKTELGKKSELLAQLHKTVIERIEELSNFCQTCNPRQKD